MFGYSVVVSEPDLKKITVDSSGTIELYSLDREIPKNTTSKAELAFSFSKRKYLGK
jgi:hypothetical protein